MCLRGNALDTGDDAAIGLCTREAKLGVGRGEIISEKAKHAC